MEITKENLLNIGFNYHRGITSIFINSQYQIMVYFYLTIDNRLIYDIILQGSPERTICLNNIDTMDKLNNVIKALNV